jgi:large subunit ribosomal protein L35
MKQKLKTRSSAAKRYRKTRTGKVVRRMAYKVHNLEKKRQKRKRNLGSNGIFFNVVLRAIRLMLPN